MAFITFVGVPMLTLDKSSTSDKLSKNVLVYSPLRADTILIITEIIPVLGTNSNTNVYLIQRKSGGQEFGAFNLSGEIFQEGERVYLKGINVGNLGSKKRLGYAGPYFMVVKYVELAVK